MGEAMTDPEYKAIAETLERYQSMDELKELIWRYGRGPVGIVALQHFAEARPRSRGFKPT